MHHLGRVAPHARPVDLPTAQAVPVTPVLPELEREMSKNSTK